MTDKKPKCKVWFCSESGYSSDGYCPRHQRQYTRTGEPVAGQDAVVLNRMCLRMRRVMSGLMGAVIWVDHNDIAHCRVCDSHSAPHEKINHKEGCVAVEARAILLGDKV